jgi:tetratricopeptide (TPR) repeat protein
MRQGDYSNASLVLTRALQQDPQNLEISKDLALDYLLQKEFTKGIDIVKPLLERDDADDQAFQIGASLYKGTNDIKEAEKVYKKALKKFPSSGAIYNDYGETLWSQGDITAIKQWERGIEKDPEFSGNYYNSARYYYFSKDKVWSIIYGEIFLNLETFTTRTAEMKTILLESYKKLYNDPEYFKNTDDKVNFERAWLEVMNKQSDIAGLGVNVESLTMIRTRFILNWFDQYGKKMPLHLLEYHRLLLQEGLFEAYNQWIFGVAQNLQAYQNWTTTHPQEYNEFSKFQKNRMFKIPKGQYYHK